MPNWPPLTPLVKRLLIAIAALFVCQLVAEQLLNWRVAEWLVLEPVLDVSLLWRTVTWPLVHGTDAGSEWRIIIECVFFWLMVSPFESRFGARRAAQALAVGWIGATFVALPVALAGVAMQKHLGFLAGIQPLVFAAFITSVSVVRNGSVLLFGVIPMNTPQVIAASLALSLLGAISRHNWVGFAGDIGSIAAAFAFARWMTTPRGSKPRSTRVPRTSGFRVIEGGKNGDDDKPKWLN